MSKIHAQTRAPGEPPIHTQRIYIHLTTFQQPVVQIGDRISKFEFNSTPPALAYRSGHRKRIESSATFAIGTPYCPGCYSCPSSPFSLNQESGRSLITNVSYGRLAVRWTLRFRHLKKRPINGADILYLPIMNGISTLIRIVRIQ